MGMSKYIYHNFYTICSLIPLLFMIGCVSTFLFVRQKSQATKHLTRAYIAISIFYFGYFISAMFYHPTSAFHRWLTISSVLPIGIHIAQFEFYFPEARNKSFARVFMIIQYVITIMATLYFYYSTFNAPKKFHFDGHYWDFDSAGPSQVIAILVILYIFTWFIIGIWRTIVTKTKDRWVVFFMSLFFFIFILIPGIVNSLSREGLVGRDTYQIIQDLSTIIAFFLATVIYLNNTKDRTSFIVKIMGISFATILVIFQYVSYLSLQDMESAYNTLRKSFLSLAIENKKYSDDIEFIIEYSNDEDNFSTIYKKDTQLPIALESIKYELLNSYVYTEIQSIKTKNIAKFKDKLKEIISQQHTYFGGYEAVIMKIISDMPKSVTDPGKYTLKELDALKRTILYTKNKTLALKNSNFRESLLKSMQKFRPGTAPFKDVLKKHLSQSNSQGAELKNEIVQYFAFMESAGSRHYRKSKDNSKHYTAFVQVDLDNKKIYEAGFNYVSYRKYLHPTSLKIIYILIGTLLFIVFGFQFFFRGAFINPIRSILSAIKKINSGDLSTRLPLKINDELGYIAKNFNSMVETIQTNKKELDDYAQNLESKVEERTEELQSAMEEMEAINRELVNTRDALWGEMELAKKIQTVLLPTEPTMTGFEISAYMKPADEVGGDYYDVINAGEKNWLVIGDVSGHGVPAGLIMMMVQTSIQVILSHNLAANPTELLVMINKTITQNIKKLNEDKYMTITVMACFNDNEFHFSGLHQDIFIYRKKSNTIETVETKGMWIGIVDDLTDMVMDDKLLLNTGDIMFLYTDGITEAVQKNTDQTESMIGEEKFKEILLKKGANSADEIKMAVLEELKKYKANDDVTMLILKKT